MATFYALGRYTAQGFQGFCKDPKSDRAAAANGCAESVGAKMISYTYVRGQYDFIVQAEGSFEQMAAIKLATEASGALKNIVICEETPLNDIASHATKVSSSYKKPGE